MTEGKAYPFLMAALQKCANQPYDRNISEVYRLIEAAMSVLGCHPSDRTLEEIAQSEFAECVRGETR